ncbi:MAG TPA: DUF3299 domain-containing protein [Acidobacteriota bacterium]|nr:DUF3299 domain-containing protein [Acidobacteriota bacterium]
MKHAVRISILILLAAFITAPSPRANDEAVEVDWATLQELDYHTGEMSDKLTKLNGKTVRIPGFMVPLDDDDEAVNEFLLVPYVGACIHTPPPPPNQLVHVKMKGRKRAEVLWWVPIWVEGQLDISSMMSAYGEVGFQVQGLSAEPYSD